MKKKVTTLLMLCCTVVFAWSQEVRFSVQVSNDSLLMGNNLEVQFELENASGRKFQAPAFEGFQVLAGPFMASNRSSINGVTTQRMKYTFHLEPLEIGNYYILPASIETSDGVLETEPILVVVVPNPDGIQQKPKEQRRELDLFAPFRDLETPPKKPRKKRSIYRI